MKTVIKREDLYNLLWKQTIAKTADQFGVKHRIIKLASIELDIPTPPQGHWTKISVGLRCDIPPLPPLELTTPSEFDFLPYIKKNMVHPNKTHRLPMTRKIHSLVVANIAYFKDYREWDRGIVLPSDHESFAISVTKGSVHRALKIMNTILWAFDKKKWIFETHRPKPLEMYVQIEGERVKFSLKESTKRINHILTKEEETRKNVGKSIWHHKFDYLPSGKLTLAIESGHGRRRNNIFTDTSSLKVEDQIGNFLAELPNISKDLRDARNERLNQQIKSDIKSNIFMELKAIQNRERNKQEKLMTDLESWYKAERLRKYIENTKDTKGSEWVRWALNHADFLDPNKKSSDTVVEVIDKLKITRSIYY